MRTLIKTAEKIKGFLNLKEGIILYNIARKASKLGPCLEIGSYCGKSAVYIGSACKKEKTVLFSIDHHKGSEEQQLGEEYFDFDLFDPDLFLVNTLNLFRKNILMTCLEDHVVTIVGKSEIIAKNWGTQLGMVFIDGSHSYTNVLTDYTCWHSYVLPKGFIVFHDIFKDSSQGGQAPYKVYKLAAKSGMFTQCKIIETLGILQVKEQ